MTHIVCEGDESGDVIGVKDLQKSDEEVLRVSSLTHRSPARTFLSICQLQLVCKLILSYPEKNPIRSKETTFCSNGKIEKY